MPRSWSLSYSVEASRQLQKLDTTASYKIVRYLEERIMTCHDPRKMGKALRGSTWEDCWRYRCGDYRIIVRIIDSDVVVVVLRVGHRKNVY